MEVVDFIKYFNAYHLIHRIGKMNLQKLPHIRWFERNYLNISNKPFKLKFF